MAGQTDGRTDVGVVVVWMTGAMSSSTAFNLDLATFHGQLKSLVSGEDSMFCDVRIKCDGGVVAANQLVLAAGSKVFKHALTR